MVIAVSLADELAHTPDRAGGPWWEGWTLVADDPSVETGVVVALVSRGPDRGGELWIVLRTPEEGVVAVVDAALALPRSGWLEIRAPGVWFDLSVGEAGEQVTVNVEAHGVGVDHLSEVGPDARGRPVPVGLDLDWSSSPGVGTAVAPLLARPIPAVGAGYRLGCRVGGEIVVGATRIEVDGTGWREHRWGPPASADDGRGPP